MKHWQGFRVIFENASKLFKWWGIGKSSKFNNITTSMMRNCCVANLRPIISKCQ